MNSLYSNIQSRYRRSWFLFFISLCISSAVIGQAPVINSISATSGCAGSSLAIQGTNLSGAVVSNVKIGGTAVSAIIANSGTALTVVVGNGNTGAVTVTTAGGTATGPVFTVYALPAIPVVSTSGPTTFCNGGSVLLYADSATSGSAIRFNGANDYVDCGVLNSNFTTVEAWFNADDLSSGYWKVIAAKWDAQLQGSDLGYELDIQPDNRVAFLVSTNGYNFAQATGTTTITAGQWYHIAGTYDGSTVRIYLNGALEGTALQTGNMFSTASHLLIGATRNGTYYSYNFNGRIDEVRVWDHARSPMELQVNKNASVANNSTGLLAYYKFDEVTGATTANAVSAANTGVLVNAPARVTPSGAPLNIYTYQWSTGATTASVNVTVSGNYTLNRTDINGCSSTSVVTPVVVNPLPVVSFTGLESPQCTTGGFVILTGSPAGGTFTGPGIIGNTFDPAVAGSGTHNISYTYTDANGCSNSSNQPVTVNVCPVLTALNLKLFLQGYCVSGTAMRPVLYDLGYSFDPAETDYITVNLWLPGHLMNQFPDYSVSSMLHTNGTASLLFPAAVNGNSWYIAVKHRNHLETWSRYPVAFTETTTYDFSTGLAKAYDDGINPPMVAIAGGAFAFYGGDINHDGAVDASDMSLVDNDNSVFAFGYNGSDVSGDGATDASDIAVVDNNQQLFLFYARPF